MVIMRAFCKFLIKFDRKIKIVFLYLTGESRLLRPQSKHLIYSHSAAAAKAKQRGRR